MDQLIGRRVSVVVNVDKVTALSPTHLEFVGTLLAIDGPWLSVKRDEDGAVIWIPIYNVRYVHEV
jgi:hypothetical protein